ncbi:hypothetical protein SALBM311S_09154 [Streptomyces alboniger]
MVRSITVNSLPCLRHLTTWRPSGRALHDARNAQCVQCWPALGCGLFVERLAGCRGQQVADPLARRPFKGFLRLQLGQGLAAVPFGGGLAQLDEFSTARLRTQAAESLVHGALADGELVDGELGVALHFLGGGRVLAGLEVDDIGAAVAVGLHTVQLAADTDLVVACF